MLTIWGRRNSANVQKVLWLAEELGMAWHHEPAGGQENAARHDALVARNPNGLVPVIEHGALTLWESNAILRYLARLYPEAECYGRSPTESAYIDQWMDWQVSTLWPQMLPYFIGLVRTPEADRDANTIETARRQTHQNFSILEQSLRPGAFLVGDRITIADVALGAFIHRWLTLNGDAATTQPLLAALHERYQTRAAFTSHIHRPPLQ
ncbi:glutathione S-transferase family protein [Aquisalimonas sp.]|uniref:glutathione S-transferase family protein n=1 Tax=unclassified Aquisalimonas TaxID=2644645 RepID=UPI0025C01CA9|nr:glutathione S-transferase family protein [Aquisalimonas sp.]